MILLDTIPIYKAPIWLIILIIVASIVCIISCVAAWAKPKWKKLFYSVFIFFVIVSIIATTGICNVHTHDEYVIELTDMPAYKFFLNYELVQTYEYSNAWRVRKRDGYK